MLWIIMATLSGILWGPIVSQVEQAKYTVVASYNDIELRDYAPMIVAEAEVSGERAQAINQGFRIIADYIFGNNAATQKVAMTAPVTQQPSKKIAMTAPVMQQASGAAWTVRFVMPASSTLETLPKPNNPAVTLKEVKGKRFAVIRFSGGSGEDNLKQHTHALLDFLSAQQLPPLSEPTYAFFNPPWTLPFLRRNEVMVEIAHV